jgi:DNA invertase Pin-like site-specific DNA recombinase
MAEHKLAPSALSIEVEIKESKLPMKRAVLYARVSTGDQHPETQLLDLRQMAKQRGYEIVPRICGNNFKFQSEKTGAGPALDRCASASV